MLSIQLFVLLTLLASWVEIRSIRAAYGIEAKWGKKFRVVADKYRRENQRLRAELDECKGVVLRTTQQPQS